MAIAFGKADIIVLQTYISFIYNFESQIQLQFNADNFSRTKICEVPYDTKGYFQVLIFTNVYERYNRH